MYRGTFIHFEPDEPEVDCRSSKMRSCSVPPGCCEDCEALEHDWKKKNIALKKYVGSLLACRQATTPRDREPQEAQPEAGELPCQCLDEDSSPEADAPEMPSRGEIPCRNLVEASSREADVPEMPSQGSLGHPGTCRRPCVHIAKATDKCKCASSSVIHRCSRCNIGYARALCILM